MRRVKFAHLHPCCFHRVDERLIHFRAADPVKQHMYLYAIARAFDQRGCKITTNITRPVNIGLEGDRGPRISNRVKHRGKNFIAILQNLVPIASNKGRPQQHPQFMQEAWIFQGIVSVDMLLDFLLAAREIDHQYHRCDCDKHSAANP